MLQFGLPVLYAVFVWWFSTGLILLLDGLPARTFRWSMAGAGIVLAGALYGLVASSASTSVGAAYCAFTCGLLVWGFNEMSFLMGYVTGPRTEPCPPDCRGFRHLIHAIGTILYHEVAILASAALVVALTWDAPNQIGVWTFMILWVMRLSSKLNVFLGVPNLTEEFLPDHLAYMKGFFRKQPMNPLFPIAVTVPTGVAALLAREAANAATPFEAAGYALVAALLALAIIEHWFLVMPTSVAPLWRWGLKTHTAAQALDAAPTKERAELRALADPSRPARDRDPPSPGKRKSSQWFEPCRAGRRSNGERIRAEFSR